jgi:hypothetical protein
LPLQVRRLQVQHWVYAEEIDGRVFKAGARTERAAQHGRRRGDIRELPAHAHDLARVRHTLEVTPMGCVRFRACRLRRHRQPAAERLKARAQD